MTTKRPPFIRRGSIVAKQPILGGVLEVCPHAKTFLETLVFEFGVTESKIVECIVNGFVHDWYKLNGIPLNSEPSALGATIRSWANEGRANNG